MKPKLIQCGAILMGAILSLANPGTARAGIHVWSGAGGSSWNLDFNWSSGGKPTVGEAPPVILVFPPAGAKLSTNDIPGLLIDQMRVSGDTYRFGASGGAVLTFNTNAPSAISNAPNCHTTIGANVVLNGTAKIEGTSAGSVKFMGAISGAGGLRVAGPTTIIAGSAANSFSGVTTVYNGELQLSKSNGPAITGDLVIGMEIAANNNESVTYLRSHQIADDVTVIVKGSGLLDLNGFSDTVGPLTLRGGEIETGAGLLTLGANVSVETHTDTSYIDGRLNLGSRSKSFTVASNAWLDVLATISGASTVGFGKSGPGLMSLSRSNSFSGPASVSEGILALFDGQALGTIDYGTTVYSGGVLQLVYTSLVTGEELTLNGHGPNDKGALALTGLSDQTIIGDIVLASPATISVATNRTLLIKGQISGPGALHKSGDGELWFDGGPANTFTGGTYVNSGQLTLGKVANVVAIPGPLFVGDNMGTFDSDVVRLLDHGQINAGAAVTVRSSGLLDIAQYTQTLGGLTLDGSAHVTVTQPGVLHLPPLVTFTGLNPLPTDPLNPVLYRTTFIDGTGEAHLMGLTTIDSTWVNHLSLRVTGAAGAHLTKVGEGFLSLGKSNSYAGLTIVKEGSVSAGNDYALGGTSAGTIVTNSGALTLNARSIAGESLVLASDGQNEFGCSLSSTATNTWAGPITLASSSRIKANTAFGTGLLRLTGAISGPGQFIKLGADPVELSGVSANSYSGGTHVNQGLLLLNKTGVLAVPGALTVGDGTNNAAADEVRLLAANQIADSSIVEVKPFGLLHLNSFSETIGSLQGGGIVSTVLGTLTAGGNNFTTTFSGLLGGIGFTSLIKQGTGTMLFTGTNSATGKTLVVGGKLFAHGSFAGPIHVSNNATLGGNGSVGHVFATNGVVNPGAGAGMIETKNLTLDAGSLFRIELNGTNGGINYDRVNVVGAVSTGNAALEAALGFAGAIGNKFTIIDNDGAEAVMGTFAGLAEGSTFVISNVQFQISYAGGDGNDVVLTQISAAPQPSLGAVSRLPGGEIQISGQGVPGSVYNVTATTNLTTANWLFIGTATSAPVNGQMMFTDTNAASFPMRFYRFVLP